MQPVNAVDVGVTRWTVEHRIARSTSAGGVRSGIGFSQIRLGFHNASGQPVPAKRADEQLSEQSPGDQFRFGIKKTAG